MSPKKAHEVERLSSLISDVIQGSSMPDYPIRHVVDAGAGQGYLSRSLSSPPYNLHVLALDSNVVQTKGAERWDTRAQKDKSKKEKNSASESESTCPQSELQLHGNGLNTGSLRHSTARITPGTFPNIIDSWFIDLSTSSDCGESDNGNNSAAPVLLVGLHACGSLTPSVLRCFNALGDQSTDSDHRSWRPAGLVVVGCCYNRIDPSGSLHSSRPCV